MTIKHAGAALLLAAGMSAASAATVVFDAYTVDYDDSTVLGSLLNSFSSGSIRGFNWDLPTALQAVSSAGATVSATFDLPSFTITANPGWALSGPLSSFFGNVSFTEVGSGATTSATATATLSVDGGTAVPVGGSISRVVLASGAGFATGYYADTATQTFGSFHSLTVSQVELTLNASGGTFASITANPQNQLRFSISAAPVPEPEAWALLLAGVGLLAGLARRRAPAAG